MALWLRALSQAGLRHSAAAVLPAGVNLQEELRVERER